MRYTRTQVYLDPDQRRRLQDEAHRKGLSMAELLRRIINEHLRSERRPVNREAYLSIVGMGQDPRPDVSEHHDRYLGEALANEHHG